MNHRIVFAGTPEISAHILQALIKANYPIVGCLSQPDRPKGRGRKLSASPVKQCAAQYQIPILQPKTLKTPEAQADLAALNPDLIIVMAYGLLLPKAVLDLPTLGCINIHASLLPQWRGAAPIQHAILNGDTQTGITIMQMDEGLDTGDMLSLYPCSIGAEETGGSLYDKLTQLGIEALLDSLPKILANNLTITKQDNSLASYASKIEKHHANINWEDSSVNIDRLIRAFNPVPMAFSFLGQARIRIISATPIQPTPKQNSPTKPGTLLQAPNQELWVQTGDGLLKITSLQFPGESPKNVKDLSKKHRCLLEIGKIFTMQETVQQRHSDG